MQVPDSHPASSARLEDEAEERQSFGPVAARFTAGLTALGNAQTVGEVYRATHELAIHLPRVEAAAILHRDDQGLLTMAHNPRGEVSPERWTRASAVLYRRWIAAHTRGEPRARLSPVLFEFEGESDVTLVPFNRGDSLLGAVLLVGAKGGHEEERTLLEVSLGSLGVIISQALTAIVSRQRLQATISRSEHEQALSDAAKALGRELHDGPLQDLAVVSMALDRALVGPGAELHDIERARQVVERLIERVRTCIGELRQGAPKQFAADTTSPLGAMLSEIEPGEVALDVDIADLSDVQLSPEIEHALVGITREALQNVRKHAHAGRVRLEVHQIGSEVELIVNDDGVGFDGASRPGHFGLEQIRELAEETGGRVEIGSLAGRGTEIRARIPLPGSRG